MKSFASRPLSALAAALAIPLALALAACNVAAPEKAETISGSNQKVGGTDTVPTRTTGTYYYTVERDGYPTLQGDSLLVKVSYSGCGVDGNFSLQYVRTGASAYDIWLFRDAGTICAAVFGETLAYKVPEEIRDAESVALVVHDQRRIVLKTGEMPTCGLGLPDAPRD